jgi:hypothetical protein
MYSMEYYEAIKKNEVAPYRIGATQEAEVRKTMVQSQPGQVVCKIPS